MRRAAAPLIQAVRRPTPQRQRRARIRERSDRYYSIYIYIYIYTNSYIYIYTLRLQFTKGTQTRTTGFTKAILFGLRSTLAKRCGLRTQYEIPKFGIRKNYFVKAKICEIGEKNILPCIIVDAPCKAASRVVNNVFAFIDLASGGRAHTSAYIWS